MKLALLSFVTLLGLTFSPALAQQNTTRTAATLVCQSEQISLSTQRVQKEGEYTLLTAEIEKRKKKIEELRTRAEALVPVIYETRCCR